MAEREKDPNAVALGRKGGLRGGKARWERVGKAERSRLMRAAASARWLSPSGPDRHERPAGPRNGPPRFVSWFSGVGGFDLPLTRGGFVCAAMCERDADARKVLERRFPGVPIHDDVRTFDASVAPGPVDLFVGGFPCQDLSGAGKQKGLAGERSGLFWEIVRYAKEVKPTGGLFENVPGLLSSPKGDRGRDFWRVLRALRECWPAVAWRVLNSQHFGVAQSRRRVYIACGPSAESAVRWLFDCVPSDTRRITRRPERWPTAGLFSTELLDFSGTRPRRQVIPTQPPPEGPSGAAERPRLYVAVPGVTAERPIVLNAVGHAFGNTMRGRVPTLTVFGDDNLVVSVETVAGPPRRAIPCAECEREAFLQESAKADYSLTREQARAILERLDRLDEHGKPLNPLVPGSLRRALEQRASEDGNGRSE